MGSQAEQKDQTRRRKLDLLQAARRGFCAGVERAIGMVELAPAKFGSPVYVRHEIVHNRYVVERLQKPEAVLFERIEDVPLRARVILSAHGLPKSLPVQVWERRLRYFDATCPLVSKVHAENERRYRAGRGIALVAHSGHPEFEGALGQLPVGTTTLVGSIADAAAYEPNSPDQPACIPQTTLSVEGSHAIVADRQCAIKAIALRSRAVLLIGALNSSHSRRLVEAATRTGARVATLIQRVSNTNWSTVVRAHAIGLSTGASAAEWLIEKVALGSEDISFDAPRALAS